MRNCPKCGSPESVTYGTVSLTNGIDWDGYQCEDCLQRFDDSDFPESNFQESADLWSEKNLRAGESQEWELSDYV